MDTLIFLFKLAYTARQRIPVLIAVMCFLFDIRMQLNVTVQRIDIPRNPSGANQQEMELNE